MGERKVLVRYIPPDFDPSIIPRFKRDRSKAAEVRMMLPFSMRCSTCGEYMGRGKKFNSRKEECVGEAYMGIRRFRFIIKCSVCSAQISFKTDPKNSDYECEWGATRNYEVWKDNEQAVAKDAEATAEEERLDSMRALENRTLDSKTEMDILDALDETLAINRRHERVDTDALLSTIEARGAEAIRAAERAEEEAELERFRQRRRLRAAAAGAGGEGGEEEQEEEGPPSASGRQDKDTSHAEVPSGADSGLAGLLARQRSAAQEGSTVPGARAAAFMPRVIVKKRRVDEPAATAGSKDKDGRPSAGGPPAVFPPTEIASAARTGTPSTSADVGIATHESNKNNINNNNSSSVGGLGGLLGSYGSGSESD
jgi:hypothetical protein